MKTTDSLDTTDFTVESWPIDRPIEYARNARKMTQEAVDKVAASIKEFGWQQCIVVDEDGVVLAGHTRLRAAKKLGLPHVPVKVASGLTDAARKAYRLADNRTATENKTDYELLALELSELKEEYGYDLALTAFDQHEIEPLLAAEWNPSADGDLDDHNREEKKEKQSDKKFIEIYEEHYEVIMQAIQALRSDEQDQNISQSRALELMAASYLAESRRDLGSGQPEPEEEE